MAVSDVDRLFTGSIPQLYDKYMVPLIFEPYAADLAARVAMRQPSCLLEIAAGTGVVTRHLASALASDVRIVATDLNQAMLDRAIAAGTIRIAQHSCDGVLPGHAAKKRDRDAGPSRLVEATNAAVAAIGKRFGHGAVEGKIQAHIVIVER